jgi:hypothetical protein
VFAVAEGCAVVVEMLAVDAAKAKLVPMKRKAHKKAAKVQIVAGIGDIRFFRFMMGLLVTYGILCIREFRGLKKLNLQTTLPSGKIATAYHIFSPPFE